MVTATATALIGLDWGTTSFRAYRIGEGGAILEKRETLDGILQAIGGDFSAVVGIQIGDWLGEEAAAPILASGMIGSKQGWLEVAYVDCPAGLGDVAAGIEQLEAFERVIHFVPGLTVRGADQIPDVMRGEETQIFGILEGADDGGRVVMPGSHSKWVEVRGGKIVDFATFMTGEVFAALCQHTILNKTMAAGAHDREAFLRGADYGLNTDASSGGLLKRLFSARTLSLFDELTPEQAPDYLSGLMIGCEVREALAMSPGEGPVYVVGSSDLATLYGVVLELAGLQAVTAPEDSAARGHYLLAEAAGLL